MFVDLAKAFESLHRSILLKKMQHHDISEEALNWFESYFLHRKLFIVYNNIKSELLSVNFGEPQRSIVGPLIFIIFINDIDHCAPNLKTVRFSD